MVERGPHISATFRQSYPTPVTIAEAEKCEHPAATWKDALQLGAQGKGARALGCAILEWNFPSC